MKKLSILLLFVCAGFSLAQAQKVRITTTVEDFVVTRMTFGCPSYGGDAALVVGFDKIDANEQELERLDKLITQFEIDNGAEIRSRTDVRDYVTTKDHIESTTTGPLSGSGKKLCDFVKSLMN